MIKLCIFDMDGTLVNTIDTIAHFGNTALKKFGLDAIPTDDYKLMVGNGSDVLIQRMLKKLGADEGLQKSVHPYYVDIYDKDFMYLTAPYDGITDMLGKVKENGVNTAILSNKDDSTAKKVSDELFEKGLVDLCLGARPGVALKPDPQAVFEIIEKFGASKDECLYIGDTATDIKTAKNAGLYSVGVLWGFRDEEELRTAGADVIISDPAEIVEIVKNR
ncbi:MAG: HAD family hydrolase [Clostridia bacterium]|nr:HAD family hydrolase [Clostridia bacterium]